MIFKSIFSAVRKHWRRISL